MKWMKLGAIAFESVITRIGFESITSHFYFYAIRAKQNVRTGCGGIELLLVTMGNDRCNSVVLGGIRMRWMRLDGISLSSLEND